MAEHNEFGKEGEEEAAAYLIDKGYSIRHRNWHCGKKELDIVAEYRGVGAAESRSSSGWMAASSLWT